MKRAPVIVCAIAVATISGMLLLPTEAESQTAKSLVQLQPTTPGTAQTGHVAVNGTVRAGTVSLGSSLENTKLRVWDGGGANAIGMGIAANQFRFHVNTTADRFAFFNAPAGTEIMSLTGTGRLGLGTSAPGSRIHVNWTTGVGVFVGNLQPFGTALFETNQSGSVAHLWCAENSNTVAYIDGGGVAFFKESVATEGRVSGYGFWSGNAVATGSSGSAYWNLNGSQYISLLPLASQFANGVVAVGDDGSIQRALLFASNNLGHLQANIKNFVEPNELDPDTDIVYASVEGPEAAAYVRGTGRLVDGRATIALPDHFRVSCIEEGMTVQLTPRSFDSKGLALGKVSLSGIEVGELHGGTGTYDFDWHVKAIRKGFKHYEPVRAWDAVMPQTDMTREELYQRRRADNQRFFRDRVERDEAVTLP